MDIQGRADLSLTDNRREVMSAFLMRMSEFFCPSDRELALRGQIKTGWSTVAARKKSRPSQVRLPPQEVKHIQEVVAQAEALQMAEELRIGVQIMKLERLRNSCRGNGTSSCVLCGYDFIHHRSRSPFSLHFCYECAQAVCSRCKSEYKCSNGETVVLCRPCSDERELWKKSGAWLSNKLPVISASEEELERAQQQHQVQKVVPLRTDFVVPASQLHIDDDDETEDDISTISGSTANYGGFTHLAGSAPSSRSPSPERSFMSEANAAAAAWRGERQPPLTELHPQSYSTLPKSHHQLSSNAKAATTMRKSGSYDLVAIHRQKASTLPSKERTFSMSRKPAMSGDRRMEDMRRRVVERKKAVEPRMVVGREIQRTPSPTFASDPLQMKCSRSNDMPVKSARLSPAMGSSQHPHIKVVVATPPHSPEMHRAAEHRSESPLMEAKMAREFTPKQPEPDSTSTSRGLSSVAHDTTPHSSPHPPPPPHHQPDSTSQQQSTGKKRKPVPSPRKKQSGSDTEYPSPSTIQQRQASRDDTKQVIMTSVEKKRYGTLEREKPSAAPRKRTGSLDKEKRRSGTLERRQRATRTPEPQGFESRESTQSSKETYFGSTKPGFTAMLPANVTRELEKEIALSKQIHPVERVKDEVEPGTPKLKDIGKTVSITSTVSSIASDGSAESGRDHADSLGSRSGSNGAGEHKWQRKGAKRAGGRQRQNNHTEADEDEFGPRSRTRTGALSGGGTPRRGHQSAEDDEQVSSRSRTRSGAVSGSDAAAIRRGRRVSPRPAHREASRQHSGSSVDRVDLSEQPLPHELFGEEAELMHRARGGNRRVGRMGGDLLVAADGEQD